MIPKIKICGLSRPQDIEAVNEAGVDYAGFVFYEKSRRNISLKKAEELMAKLDRGISAVAVCVSPTAEQVEAFVGAGFSIVQIHGTVPADALSDGGIPLWQAVNLSGGLHAWRLIDHPRIRGYVVDGAGYGGGETFGWENDAEVVEAVREPIRRDFGGRTFILAGGLTADNVGAGIRLLAPDVVDVSSGVEEDGKKSGKLIEAFVRKVREQ